MRKRNHFRCSILSAQVTLEFIFCFLVVLLIFYSCVRALQWFGQAIVAPHHEHRKMHQTAPLTQQMETPSDHYPRIRLIYDDEFLPTRY